MSRMIIIGGGQAGFSISYKLRSMGFRGPIEIIAAENYLPYQRPPLSKKFLKGEVPRERLFFKPDIFYKENNISIKLGVRVENIDRSSCSVYCDDGTRLNYKKLFLTTGSVPRQFPDNLGGSLRKNYYVRSLYDIDALSDEFKPGKRVLIIGGGYIGLEMAAAAREKNLEVTLVEVEERILKRVASSNTANYFRVLHENHGVKIIEGRSILRLIEKSGKFVGALLDDGTQVSADFSIIGIGAKPNTKLAELCGLKSNNGIWVDRFCQTSDANILAAGDCTNFPFRLGRMRLESVGNAIEQAHVAAMTALGHKEKYNPKPWFWSDQYKTKLQIAGLSSAYDQIVERKKNDSLSIWYYKEEKLIAVDAINDAKAYMVGKRLIELEKSPEIIRLVDTMVDLKSLLKSV